jgi:hypothetical protein
MLLRNGETGGFLLYNIANNQITGTTFLGTVGREWQFSGVGNFSGVPGETDLLLRNVVTGANIALPLACLDSARHASCMMALAAIPARHPAACADEVIYYEVTRVTKLPHRD